ncbi:ABC transporter permease [Dysgonomonas termitidis]|uniref:ABC transporter permease n=1 Tax=Dysgonomonas termitidis TaxID=1516126 RepID=A0ABV9L3Z3_9BACT
MKQFFRNFRKQKTVGTLNICGLSLGIMVSVTVGLWAINELSFDNFHKNGERMYRVVQNFRYSSKPVRAATAFKPLGELAAAEIPEIEQMCRVVIENNGIEIDQITYFNVRNIITDHNFFSFFTFPLKEGDIKTAFSAPDNVIFTESAARKYFPNENPMGKTVRFHGWTFTVSAIMYDMPKNSHIQADVVFPLFSFFKDWQWESSFNYDTYFILLPGTDIHSIENKVTQINKRGISTFIRDANFSVDLEPLKEIHFSKTSAGFDSAVKGNKGLLNTFIGVAIAILIIACINFTNLFISTSFIRAKTIGIKKSLGAGKKLLIVDFYKETAIYILIAIFLGILLTTVALPVFNNYTRSNVVLDFFSPGLYIFTVSLFIITILMAGSFPAFQMTKFGVIETLRGKFRGKRMSVFQKILIIIQFTTSICLLIIVLFFAKQIDQILDQDLGFDNKNIVYMNGWRDFGRDYKALREELVQDPSIMDVAMKQYDLPLEMGNGIGGKNVENGEQILLDLSEVSPNYFDFFRMEFIAGENPLYQESAASSRFCVLNERAVQLLGLKDPVGKSFQIISIGGKLSENEGKEYVVKGVIRDSYVKSLYQEPDAQMYLNLSRDDHNPIFFKIAGDPQRAIRTIEKKWKQMLPNVPFEYHYLDTTYEAQYASEMSARNVLSYALVITLIITVMGLYAMIFYSTQRRIKEIGIRKINGATVLDLLALLNKDTIIWIIISFLIACPVSYYFVARWLDGFVVKTSLSIWVFLGAGALSFIIAMLTVCYQTWKAANMNPVDAIQNE